MKTAALNEEAMQMREHLMSRESELLYDEYRPYMDLLEQTNLAKVRSLQAYDYWALGKQLEQFRFMKKVLEDNGNIGQLGTIPKIAYDVITIAYGNSVIPIVASVQPIDEYQGIVYFANVRAETTKGNYTGGTTLLTQVQTGQTIPRNYASNFTSAVLVSSSTNATVTYSGTLSAVPVVPGTFQITTTVTAAPSGFDDGNGNIVGIGISGSITYSTGAWSLTFAANPTGGKVINATYIQNYEAATDIPQISNPFSSTSVLAYMYALKATVGMFQQFALQKRFGMSAEEELARHLVEQINSEIGGDLINKMYLAAVGVGSTGGSGTNTVNFPQTPATNIADMAHIQSYRLRMNQSEATMAGNAGRGVIAGIIADRNFAAFIATLPGFKKIFDGKAVGLHLYGTFDDIPVVRVLDTNVLPANKQINFFKGPNPWEAPAVWAPYMPLTTTELLHNVQNPLLGTRAAAVWGATQAVIPQFATLMNLQ